MNYFFRNLKYLCQVNLKTLKRANAAGGLVNNDQLHELIYILKDEIIDEIQYGLFGDLNVRRAAPKVKTIDESLDAVATQKASLCRFGDGELNLIAERDINFQKASPLLAKRLGEVLSSQNPNIFIAIPRVLYSVEEPHRNLSISWLKRSKFMREIIGRYIEQDAQVQYYATEVTLAYAVYDTDFYDMEVYFRRFQDIWRERDIAIICGDRVFDKINTNIFDCASSVEYIHVPSVNAFESYNAIMDKALKIDKQKLVIAILGPTATVLAYDLGSMGYQALDLGHIAKAYDWYLKNKTTARSTFFAPD